MSNGTPAELAKLNNMGIQLLNLNTKNEIIRIDSKASVTFFEDLIKQEKEEARQKSFAATPKKVFSQETINTRYVENEFDKLAEDLGDILIQHHPNLRAALLEKFHEHCWKASRLPPKNIPISPPAAVPIQIPIKSNSTTTNQNTPNASNKNNQNESTSKTTAAPPTTPVVVKKVDDIDTKIVENLKAFLKFVNEPIPSSKTIVVNTDSINKANTSSSSSGSVPVDSSTSFSSNSSSSSATATATAVPSQIDSSGTTATTTISANTAPVDPNTTNSSSSSSSSSSLAIVAPVSNTTTATTTIPSPFSSNVIDEKRLRLKRALVTAICYDISGTNINKVYFTTTIFIFAKFY